MNKKRNSPFFRCSDGEQEVITVTQLTAFAKAAENVKEVSNGANGAVR